MGLLSTSSSVETVAGRVRFTPAPPEPWWKKLFEGITWVAPALLIVISVGAGEVDLLVLLIGLLWAAAVVSAIFGRIARRGMPAAPTEPFDVPADLLDEVRGLARKGQDVEAMRAVRARLGVGLIDARRIVDAAVARLK